MALTIESFVGGPIETNAFLVADDATREAIVVDAPMDVADRIERAATTAGLRVTLIVITHTHWDHIGDAAELKTRLRAPLAAHQLAVEPLAHPGSATMELPFTIPPVTPDRLLADGDEVRLGDHVFRVMHLPGHDPSHIALVSEPDRVFLGGDVLFPAGHGRVDIPGADQDTMNRSLARLVDLPPDTVVYPGHGRTTTIGAERWLVSR
ncbi:MAG TPA: MBL fold metallo-hydrolase [Thermomicrobiales bacterium]|jgi:glyoxylase-like metal-dependent hydrolase (beta-lactamase superfamily II)